MPTGTVKWFNTTKGYGFIAPDEGGREHVHDTTTTPARLQCASAQRHGLAPCPGVMRLPEGASSILRHPVGRMGFSPFVNVVAGCSRPYSSTFWNSRHSRLLMPQFSSVTSSPASIRFTQSTIWADMVTAPRR